MTGRDSGRGGRGGFDRDRPDRPRGNTRERPPMGGFRGPAPSTARPWERRDDARPPRPTGDRPFDRPDRDPDVRVEHYYPEEQRPRRDEHDGLSRPGGPRDQRFGQPEGDRPFRAPRDSAPPTPAARPPSQGPDVAHKAPPVIAAMLPPPDLIAPLTSAAVTERIWNYVHLSDSWREEERLHGWTPSNDELREMVEDNIEADPLLSARDKRNIAVGVEHGQVTLTGVVRGRRAKFAAGCDAFWTFGVSDVRNTLAIKERGPRASVTAAGVEPASATTDTSAALPLGTRAIAQVTATPSTPPVRAAVLDAPGTGASVPQAAVKKAARTRKAASAAEPTATTASSDADDNAE